MRQDAPSPLWLSHVCPGRTVPEVPLSDPWEGAAECRHCTLPCSTKRLPEMAESTNETRAEPGSCSSEQGTAAVLMAASPPLFRTQMMKGSAEWTQGRKNLGPFDTQSPRANGFWVSLQHYSLPASSFIFKPLPALSGL